MYSAAMGRFLQPDPIRFDAGDVNIYRYVQNNMVNATDPYGLGPNWHCAGRRARNHKNPPSTIGAARRSGGTETPSWMNALHKKGSTKVIWNDGKEQTYSNGKLNRGDGTYNYVTPVIPTRTTGLASIVGSWGGHLFADIIPSFAFDCE